MNNKKRMVTIIEGNGSPMRVRKQDRNELCFCKSGRKAKNCCGCEARYYHSKLREEPIINPSAGSTEEIAQP